VLVLGDVLMEIRRATVKDTDAINALLRQVLEVHHKGRPDIFKSDTKKYTDEELEKIISDDSKPIFVALDGDIVKGYAFCVFQQYINNNILTDIKTLYIDDLCVDKNFRGQHIGKQLYEYVIDFAKKNGCYNVTLNVWSCNENALRFYEKCGLVPQKIGMEKIL
jgi:ribosomal protein S18 acetylase RimI-like enzyme